MERPSPGIGVVIGGVGFGVRTEAESRMRTECRESTGSDSSLKSVNVIRHDNVGCEDPGSVGGKTIVCGTEPAPVARITESLA